MFQKDRVCLGADHEVHVLAVVNEEAFLMDELGVFTWLSKGFYEQAGSLISVAPIFGIVYIGDLVDTRVEHKGVLAEG